MRLAPHHRRFAAELPPKGKPWNKADNFCLIVRKHDETRGSRVVAENFFQARGRRVAADNFANFFARKMSKDKA